MRTKMLLLIILNVFACNFSGQVIHAMNSNTQTGKDKLESVDSKQSCSKRKSSGQSEQETKRRCLDQNSSAPISTFTTLHNEGTLDSKNCSPSVDQFFLPIDSYTCLHEDCNRPFMLKRFFTLDELIEHTATMHSNDTPPNTNTTQSAPIVINITNNYYTAPPLPYQAEINEQFEYNQAPAYNTTSQEKLEEEEEEEEEMSDEQKAFLMYGLNNHTQEQPPAIQKILKSHLLARFQNYCSHCKIRFNSVQETAKHWKEKHT